MSRRAAADGVALILVDASSVCMGASDEGDKCRSRTRLLEIGLRGKAVAIDVFVE
jgi:hypothetical protein